METFNAIRARDRADRRLSHKRIDAGLRPKSMRTKTGMVDARVLCFALLEHHLFGCARRKTTDENGNGYSCPRMPDDQLGFRPFERNEQDPTPRVLLGEREKEKSSTSRKMERDVPRPVGARAWLHDRAAAV